MSCVIIPYPVWLYLRLRVQAWRASSCPRSWGRSKLEGKSATKDVTTTAGIQEVCGNVFASGV